MTVPDALQPTLTAYLAYVRDERRFSEHTVAAYAADLNDLAAFAASHGVDEVNDLIDIELPGGACLQAQITHDSTVHLELQAGTEVVALIKAGWRILGFMYCLIFSIAFDSIWRTRSAVRP